MPEFDMWGPAASGARLVDFDRLKAAQALGEIAMQPIEMKLKQSHAALYEAQAAKEQEAAVQQKAMAARLAQLQANQSASGVDDPVAQIYEVANTVMPTDPHKGSQIANIGSQMASRVVTAQTNEARQAKLIADTKIAQFDLSAREIGLTTDETSLGDALRNFEKRTGMKSGLVDPSTGQLYPQIKFNPSLRQMMVEKLTSTKDQLSFEMQQRRDATLRSEFESRQRHRDFNENLEELRKREEVRAAARAKKVGATTLKAEDVKAGTDAVTAEYPSLVERGEPTAEARNLGREVVERANQLRVGNDVLTATEARQRAMDTMKKEGMFAGARGTGKTAAAAIPLPRTPDGKPNISAIKPGLWYQTPQGPRFVTPDKKVLTPQEYQQLQGTQGSVRSASPLTKDEDDDEDED